MSERFPVYVSVTRDDGRTEQVKVGTAVREGDGFTLLFDAMHIGGSGAARASSSAAPARRAPARASSGAGPSADGLVFPPYGRSKGMPVSGASMQDLEFYANGSRRTLADPSKSRWHDKERGFLAALEAEMARQRGEDPSGGDDVPPPTDADGPPPSDEDAPF